MALNIKQRGQVFTPENIVNSMLSLRKNSGRVLEPSAGSGHFLKAIPGAVGIEIDSMVAHAGCLCMDFFDYDTTEKFDTIIGNPPYVGFKSITEETKAKLPIGRFDRRTNLYVFFIDKCLDHLTDTGELIFITPRDFLQATHAKPLQERLWQTGTITHLDDLGDSRIFEGYSPNCVIWRFEKGNFTRTTLIDGAVRQSVLLEGQIGFMREGYTIPFKDLFSVRVGAVSGLDEVFANELIGDMDFIYSKTVSTGETRKMITIEPGIYSLEDALPWFYISQHHDILINRRIRNFNETNWWQWGRWHHESDKDRVYVNCKTRVKRPFFTHPCKNYEGSILAIFPHGDLDCQLAADMLNDVDWKDLGFVCDGRYIFSQRSLENIYLPNTFKVLS
jgi:adenine-specific DNA-methyltransferase